MPRTEARRLAQRCCCSGSLPASVSQVKPAFSLLQAPWTGFMPHASTCLALPCLALPQLNWPALQLRFPTCTCHSTLDAHPRPRSPIRFASASFLPGKPGTQSSAGLFGSICPLAASLYFVLCSLYSVLCSPSSISRSLHLVPSLLSRLVSPLAVFAA